MPKASGKLENLPSLFWSFEYTTFLV